jgi:hypothetical protein
MPVARWLRTDTPADDRDDVPVGADSSVDRVAIVRPVTEGVGEPPTARGQTVGHRTAAGRDASEVQTARTAPDDLVPGGATPADVGDELGGSPAPAATLLQDTDAADDC